MKSIILFLALLIAATAVNAQITGSHTLCHGTNTMLTSDVPGGVWSSSNNAIATVSGGDVGGVSSGTATISYMVGSFLVGTHLITVDNIIPITGITALCNSGTYVESHSVPGGTWGLEAGYGSIEPSGTSAVVTSEMPGPQLVTYTYDNGCGLVTAEKWIKTQFEAPPVYVVDGSSSTYPTATIFVGESHIVDVAPFYTAEQWGETSLGDWSYSWSGGNSSLTLIPHPLSADIIAMSPGTATLSYSWSNLCGVTQQNTLDVNIIDALAITGVHCYPEDGMFCICNGSTATFNANLPDGEWTIGGEGIISLTSISGNNQSLHVSAVSPGITTITYTWGDHSVTKQVRVLPGPAGPITGPDEMCTGTPGGFSDDVPGGHWFSSDPTVVAINETTGAATALQPGTVTISYNLLTGCPGGLSQKTVHVLQTPWLPPLTEIGTICSGETVHITAGTFLDGTSVTAANPFVLLVNSIFPELVFGGLPGTTTVTATFPGNACGATVTQTITGTVITVPEVSSILGPDTICVGSSAIVNAIIPGGEWLTLFPSVLSITPVSEFAASITGHIAGSSTINYRTTNRCGSSTWGGITIYIKDVPEPSTLSAPSTLAVGDSIIVSVTPPDGILSGTGGIQINQLTVKGIAVGTATLTYSKTNSCGANIPAYASIEITASLLPITGGALFLCPGLSTAYTDATPGGSWSIGNTGIAIVDGSGNVTGVAEGTTQLTYTVGSDFVTTTITVDPAPDAGTISGPTEVCVGTSIALSSTGDDGIWSLIGAAGIDATGILTGLMAGAVSVAYTDSNSCGIDIAGFEIAVLGIPVVLGIDGPDHVCVDATIALSNATPDGTWSSSDNSIAGVSGGTVTGISVGTVTITFTVTNICGTTSAYTTVTVDPLPDAGTLSGPSSVCVGATAAVSSTVPGGSWSSSNTAVAVVSGSVVTGISAGSAMLTYTFTNNCGTAYAYLPITVAPLLDAGTLSGPSSVCVGVTAGISSSVTGGTWSSSNTSIAVVDGSGVTGISAGSVTITYTITNSCGSAYAYLPVTVDPLPDAGTLSGPATVCVGATAGLSSTSAGGTWSSSNSDVAAVSGSGVTGISASSATLTYTVTNSCGTVSDYLPITVDPLPDAGTLSGPSTVCVGATAGLSSTVAGGTWSSSNSSIAVVSGSGVTGISVGSATLTYTVTNNCGTASAYLSITVDPLPDAGTLSGPSTVCVGATAGLSSTVAGGTWSSSNSEVAAVSGSGITGFSVGSATLTYTVTNNCGTASAYLSITVDPLPDAGTLSGPSTVCVGATAGLSSTVAGGTWSSSNSSIADISGSGVTGISVGSATLTYTITNSCGTVSDYLPIAVDPLPVAGTVSGPATVCVGATSGLSSTSDGGTWSSSNSDVVAVSGSGVTGISAGSATLTYTVTNNCGTASAYLPITVDPLPHAGTISGSAAVCAGMTIALSETISGGVWSSSNTAKANVNASGVVTGVSAGSATITYTVTNGCGTAFTTTNITINAYSMPAVAAISGPNSVCVGSTIVLIDATTGGAWSSGNAAIANVSGGVVTGVSAGVVTISYSVSNVCTTNRATKTITVNPQPLSPVISGASEVCVGAAITLACSPSGTWSRVGTAGTVSSAGVVTGVLAGTVKIKNTITNSCGSRVDSISIIVNPLPSAGTISGATSVCAGASTIYTDAVVSGTWSSSNSSVAVVSGGTVTGISAGTATISYSVTNSCGTANAVKTITVNPQPLSPVISGASEVCVGAAITLACSPSGTWSRVGTAGTVSTAGIVTGVSAGTVKIKNTISNSCGSRVDSITITVNPLPSAGTISGATSVCAGLSTVFTDAVLGGTWSSSNSSVAVVSGGIVTGILAGTATISYSVTNSCGTANAVKTITVNPQPLSPVISGASEVCVGAAITLACSPSGTWSRVGTAGTVSTAGVVTGVSAGTVKIKNTITNSCGSRVDSMTITVNPLPVAGTISGATSVCAGASTIYTDPVVGGTWSSSNSSVAVVSGGTVTGISAGTATISYSVTNSCGTANAVKTITVNPQPLSPVISGASEVCVGAAITLACSPSGTWSRVGTAGTVSTAGVVTGVLAGTVKIKNTISNSCGSRVDSITITVNPLPSAGTISGATSVCAGISTIFTDAVVGGTWSSSNSSVAVVSSGIVTGVSAGTATISYSVTNSCGTANAVKAITVNPQPLTPVISGEPSVCVSASIVLYASPSGTWSRVGTAGTVSTTGIVTGVAAGTVKIKNTITNTCGTRVDSVTITVNPLPVAGTISGASSVCVGSSVSLNDPISGGTWTSSNASIAIVSVGGVVTGMSAGVADITYAVTNSCDVAYAIKSIIVNPQPLSPVISGPSDVCIGTAIALTSAPGGTWSRVGSAANISTTGVVTGIAVGTVKVKNTITNTCGSRVDSITITVHSAITAGAITGDSSVCETASVILANTATGGIWSSSNPSLAVVSGGIVTGIAAGTDTILYSVANAWCTAIARKTITVNPQPDSGIISGTASVDVGSSVVLSESVAGGTWSSSGGVASVDGSGTVSGISVGAEIVSYTVTNSCGTRRAYYTIGVTTPFEAKSSQTEVAGAGSARVFPNPTTGVLNISWLTQLKGMADLTITDITGREVFKDVWELKAVSGTESADLSTLQTGVYFVSIQSADIHYACKIFVER